MSLRRSGAFSSPKRKLQTMDGSEVRADGQVESQRQSEGAHPPSRPLPPERLEGCADRVQSDLKVDEAMMRAALETRASPRLNGLLLAVGPRESGMESTYTPPNHTL